MKNKLLIIIALLFCKVSFAQQNFTIKGCIRNLQYNRLYLAEIIGDRSIIIDSTVTVKDCFEFSLRGNRSPGMYSIILNTKTNAYIRVIFNKEDIELTTDLKHLLSTMEFSKSEENKLFYAHEKLAGATEQKMESIEKLKKLYGQDDKFYFILNSEITGLNDKLVKETNDIINQHPATFVSRFFKAQQRVVLPNGSPSEQKDYLKTHFFDNIDLTYLPITRAADLLPNTIRNYIFLFEDKSLTYQEQEKRYEHAVDDILSGRVMSTEMKDFFIKELLADFQFGDYDIIGAYVSEKYVLSNTCESGLKQTDITSRIDKIRRVAVGKQAPDVSVINAKGEKLELSSISDKYVLLVFWASTCPHCTEMMPQLKKWYDLKKSKVLDIWSISLDVDEKKYKEFLRNEIYTWLDYCDYKGAYGPITDIYNITGTPTFFLIDKNKRIVAKPSAYEEFISAFESIRMLN